jgi:ribosomal-protein-alanine N-acetyltransferase
MSGEVPVLETERLMLREFRGSDFESMARFYDDTVSRFYCGPCDREEAFRKFAVYPGHWTLRGYGPWALESKATGEYLGLCGLWFPEGWIEPEITWALLPEFHGNGFATEAARRALQAAYEMFDWPTAVSVISIDNPASAAVATRLGATLERRVEYRYGPAYLYRHAPLDRL